MIIQLLQEIFEREITHLKEEILLYKNEQLLWDIRSGINNSAGNIGLHLIGNLNHFIGATLGNSGYVRDRDKEFTDKNIPREILLNKLDQTSVIIRDTLSRLNDNDLEKNFPLDKHGKTVTTGFMLLHLLSHFQYHLGQINYHRRLITN